MSIATRLANNRDLFTAYPRAWLLGAREREAFGAIETYCLFVGYPRSGHSLLGALVDAHPDAVISHEMDALRYVKTGFRRTQLFALILEKSRRDAGDRRSGAYVQHVPNQWQGRYRTLRVIGDKKGGGTTRMFIEEPELLGRLQRTVGVPVRALHVVRNPYDNISTLHAKDRSGRTLPEVVDLYFERARGVLRTKEELGERVLDIRHEDLVRQPQETLGRVCAFLGLETEPQYLSDCASIVWPEPATARTRAPWTPALLDVVAERMAEIDFLSDYRRDD